MRPIRASDHDALVALTDRSGYGLTSLPKDRALLGKRIERSLQGFAKDVSDGPKGEEYLFALEDTASREMIGISGIVSKVGGFEPFYAYRIETTSRESKVLGIRKEIDVLHLVKDHSGPCEIGSLFLHPERRATGGGRLLSLARFLFMADFGGLFEPVVIAEMRGVVDDAGRSPFWESLGRHFFEIDYPTADYLSVQNKRFISELMPEHPIYIPLLSPEAQAVIGEVHPVTRPGLALLRSEGFTPTGMVDIFEAGPVISCTASDIRSIRDSRVGTIAGVRDRLPSDSAPHLVSNRKRAFRACRCRLSVRGEMVDIQREAAEALGVEVGSTVRYVPPKAEEAR